MGKVISHSKLLLLAIVLVVGIVAPHAVQAQWTPDADLFPYKLQVPIGGLSEVDNLGEYIAELYRFFVGAAMIVAVVVIMFAGLQRLTAQGNQEALSQSTERVMHAIYGLTIALLSYIILVMINPQLVELDLNIKTVEIDSLDQNAQRLCPSTMADAVCQGGIKPVPEEDGGGFCIGINSPGKGNVCEIEKLASDRSYLVKTYSVSLWNEDHLFPIKLEEAGWQPKLSLNYSFSIPPQIYAERDFQIVPKDCEAPLLERAQQYCNTDPGKQIPCGKIIYAGSITESEGFGYKNERQQYTLGSWCPPNSNSSRTLTCYADLENIGFSSSGNADEGTVTGVRCQPI